MTVITELIIVRHGEAHCNIAGLVGGEKTCTGLTARGQQQVKRLSERLRRSHQAGERIDVLYSAPRLRVRETATIIAGTLGLPVCVIPGLTGPWHGEADGLTWEEVKTAFGGPPQSQPDRRYAPSSETWNQYVIRATDCLARLLQRHCGQRLLIAGHSETVDAAFTTMLDLPPDICTRVAFACDHASLTRWHMRRNRLGKDVWILSAFNDTTHLEGA